MGRWTCRALGVLVGLALCASWAAAVTPHGLFTDNAVLQQGVEVPVWGTAKDGEKVTVKFAGQEASTTAKDGKWMVRLKPLKAGGPSEMTIAGENTVVLKNILVGEVWVCSGQSNMAMSLVSCESAQEDIAKSADPMLRLFSVPRQPADTPQSEVKGSWSECGPTTAPGFSGVGYYFGRELRKGLKIPVGLIHSSWGGTPAEAWTSRKTLESKPEFKDVLDRYAQAVENYPQALEKHKKALEDHKVAVEKAKAEGKAPPRVPYPPYGPESQQRPSCLYNGMIAPLLPYAIRGTTWYQGEANAGRAYQYRTLLPAMIQNWRQDWGTDLVFLIVQLAPYMAISPEPQESAWAELRESQTLTAFTVPKCGLAVITDAGDEKDIHPKKKEPAGARLALAARAIAYGEKIVYSGPLYDSLKVEGNRAVLSFKHVGGGLVAKDGELKGFAIAGEDKKFVNAKAEIQGDKVVVTSQGVQKPVAVRYGWANFPVVNLFNKDGLPACPFRTDDFPMTTKPK